MTTTSRSSGTASKKKASVPKPYHHGSLPQALLAAAERVLVRDGIAGLGLRAIAREAEVSHTAPKHHFGGITELLSELAAVGFRRLRAAMIASMDNVADARDRRSAIGYTYVHFAHENPALFGLMFRNEIIDMRYAPLSQAAADALRVMAPTISGEAIGSKPMPDHLCAADAMRVTAAWAYVHGLATLLVDHRLRGILRVAPDFDDQLALVDRVLRDVQMGLDFAS